MSQPSFQAEGLLSTATAQNADCMQLKKHCSAVSRSFAGYCFTIGPYKAPPKRTKQSGINLTCKYKCKWKVTFYLITVNISYICVYIDIFIFSFLVCVYRNESSSEESRT